MFNTQSLVFNAQFLVFNTQFMIFTHVPHGLLDLVASDGEVEFPFVVVSVRVIPEVLRAAQVPAPENISG